MAKLKPWYNDVSPREDLRSGKPLDASEFAVHLDHVREGRAPEDYQKPDRFFERTYMTRNLQDLAAEAVRRLSGEKLQTSAVFNMATQFGGGKTHALTLLYHLATGGPRAASWRGVSGILGQAGVPSVPKADTAVFVGTEFDSLSGRGGDDGTPYRRTPWGEIAWQLGRGAAFARVVAHDEQGVAPAGDVIRSFLPQGPALILVDELMNYISRNRKSGLSAQFYSFLQSLGEEARARDNLVLVVSVPGSELEMNTEDQRDYESIKKLLDRLGKAIIMSAEMETAEIIRRRLFEWHGLPDEGARTAAEYADWAIEHHESLGDVDVDSLRERFRTSYPFHPAVLSVFERKWQALPRFQRTRGVLRLLALWVSRAYEAGYKGAHRDPLITLGTAPLEDPYFRSALFEQLGSDGLEGPVTTDIAGSPEAHGVRLDREASEEVRKARLHQKVATTILFESNGGMTRAEATPPEIRFAVGDPDLDIANVEAALEALVDSCYYLSAERNRYRYSITPNLNKMLTDRRASIQPSAIDERVPQEVQGIFKAGVPGFSRIYFPQKSSEVPDRPALTLVVLGPDQPLSQPGTRKSIESILREHGASGRTFKTALVFSVADDASGLRSEAKDLLAWEDIADDQTTVQRLDDNQTRQLKTGRDKAGRDLKEAIWRAYKYVVILGKDNALKEIDLGLVHSSMAGSMAEVIVNRLRMEDEITEAVGPNKLVRYWPPAMTEWSTKSVRDAFFSSPALPRLLDPNAIRRTIQDGVSQKILAYAGKNAEGRFDPIYFGISIAEADIEIGEDTFLLKAADAMRYIEPLRLQRIEVQPSSVRLRPGNTTTFTVRGFDQHDQSFAVGAAEWTSTSGTMGPGGSFTATVTPGTCSVSARVGDLVAAAQVEVVEGTRPNPDPNPKSGIQWQGDVPTQKWMNFYTKVLSRFASVPGLKLRVSFELPASESVTEAKLEETRTALRELGLEEKLERTLW